VVDFGLSAGDTRGMDEDPPMNYRSLSRLLDVVREDMRVLRKRLDVIERRIGSTGARGQRTRESVTDMFVTYDDLQ
jgi:hypothetical protein